MPSSSSWIDRSLAAWRNAEQSTDRIDTGVELFFTTLMMEARGSRVRREAMIGEVADAEIEPAWLHKLLATATNAVITWCAGDFVAAARAFAKLVAVGKAKLPPGKSVGKDTARQEPRPPSNQIVGQTLAREALVIHALTWQAACETREERLEHAAALLDEAERRLGEFLWPNCRGWLHAERGRLAFWHDRITASLAEYARAEASFQTVENRFALANICEGQARILIHVGQYLPALQQLTRADAWRDPSDKLGAVKRLYHIGRVFRYQRNWGEAVRQLEQAFELLRNGVDNRRWEAHVLDVLGDLYLLQGDVASAGKRFRAVVFQDPDPVFVLRHRYRMAKLRLEQAKPLRHTKQRRQAIEDVLKECDELIRTGTMQQLAAKAWRLKGSALRVVEQWTDAAECFETAAERFREHRSNWYVSDCLREAGECLILANAPLSAAVHFLGAIRAAVDDVQRHDAVTALHDRFQQLDAQRVSELLTELLVEREKLRSERDHWEGRFATFQELMRGIVSEFDLIGGLRHIPAGLELIKSPDEFQDGVAVIQQGYHRASRMAAFLRENVRAALPAVLPWTWCSVAAICQPLPAEVSQDKSDDRFDDWGLFASADQLHAALGVLIHFATARSEFKTACTQLNTQQRLLRIEIKLTGKTFPHKCSMLDLSLSIGDLEAWNLDNASAARLNAAARFIQSLGGETKFRKVAKTSKLARQSACLVTVEVPVSPKLPEITRSTSTP